MINDEMKQKLENNLNEYKKQMINRENNIQGGKYIIFVGFAGSIAGIAIQSHNHMMAGLIVEAGGLLFQLLSKNKLEKIKSKEESLEYILENHENFEFFENEEGIIEIYSKNNKKKSHGKHFKK